MVRVDHCSVLAVAQAVDALVEIFESDREVERIPAGRQEAETGRSQGGRLHQGHHRESNERSLLSEPLC